VPPTITQLAGYQVVVRLSDKGKPLHERVMTAIATVNGKLPGIDSLDWHPGSNEDEIVFDLILKPDLMLGYSAQSVLNLWLVAEKEPVPLVWWTQAKVGEDWQLVPLFEPLR
jgi:hypothetical protein